jgi:microsomal dipeptidase-like Zn-dependent dipeptidase
MVGFSLYPHHLRGGSDCSLADFAEMALEMMQSYGAGMFGIGSDLCQDQPDSVVNWMRNGHWRKHPAPPIAFPDCPSWFGDNRDFPGLAPGLEAAGMTGAEVAGLLGGNWMRFWQEAFVKP